MTRCMVGQTGQGMNVSGIVSVMACIVVCGRRLGVNSDLGKEPVEQ